MMALIVFLSNLSLSLGQAGLLGAGTGAGSCAAPPYRASSLYWTGGCPLYAECCTEFGYCRSSDDWYRKASYRDCNGERNGLPLPAEVIRLELIERLEDRLSADDRLLGISFSWFTSSIRSPGRVNNEGSQENAVSSKGLGSNGFSSSSSKNVVTQKQIGTSLYSQRQENKRIMSSSVSSVRNNREENLKRNVGSTLHRRNPKKRIILIRRTNNGEDYSSSPTNKNIQSESATGYPKVDSYSITRVNNGEPLRSYSLTVTKNKKENSAGPFTLPLKAGSQRQITNFRNTFTVPLEIGSQNVRNNQEGQDNSNRNSNEENSKKRRIPTRRTNNGDNYSSLPTIGNIQSETAYPKVDSYSTRRVKNTEPLRSYSSSLTVTQNKKANSPTSFSSPPKAESQRRVTNSRRNFTVPLQTQNVGKYRDEKTNSPGSSSEYPGGSWIGGADVEQFSSEETSSAVRSRFRCLAPVGEDGRELCF